MACRRLPLPICALTLIVGTAGCSSSDKATAASSSVNLAFIPKTSNNLVFKMGNDGAQLSGRNLTRLYGKQVSVEYMAAPELEPTVEQGLVRQAIAAKKDALIVSCLDDSLTAPIDEAVAAGIPVITFDSDCPNSKRLGFYSMQSENSGAKGADLLAKAMGAGPKSVAILTGRAGADNLERRVSGFLNRLAANYPNITVVSTVNCLETSASCGVAVEDQIVSQFPDLDGLFVVGLWGIAGACNCNESGMTCVCEDTQMPYWKAAAKRKLKTVAYDSMPFELTLMEQGYVSALIGQKYFGWGYDTVGLMYDHLTNGTPVQAFIDSGFDVVCPNNFADMRSKWQAADFTVPLAPECVL